MNIKLTQTERDFFFCSSKLHMVLRETKLWGNACF